MINQENAATFIDDIIMTINTKKEHNELVEEILKKLEKNNLFVKPKKCWWKIKEVEFLDMVIGPWGIEIQKEKVNGVLNWPISRNVKEMQKFLELANYYR